MKHKDSGMRCLVLHRKDGVVQPPCMICDNCGHVPWGNYDMECIYTGEDPSTCTHIWEVREYYRDFKQIERCMKCHTQETHPAQSDSRTPAPR